MKIRSPFFFWGTALIFFAAIIITLLSPPQSAPTPIPELVQVRNVIDGDTIDLVDGRRVRYIGIDAPETAHAEKSGQCYGNESKTANSRLVSGKSVRLVGDVSETDSYGRILRYVYADNVFVNENLVRTGYARAFSYAPDVKYQQLFTDAETLARRNNLGLWSRCKSE